MADTGTLTRPSPKEAKAGLTDKAEVSHIINEGDWYKGYVLGQEIQALCGIRWTPWKDPEKLPVCPACQEIYERLMGV
jgi:hypothetical protein